MRRTTVRLHPTRNIFDGSDTNSLSAPQRLQLNTLRADQFKVLLGSTFLLGRISLLVASTSLRHHGTYTPSAEVVAVAQPGKKQLNTYLDDDAYDGLFDFATRHGGNTTAFLTALGRALASVERPPRWLDPILAEARQIDSQRKRRRKDS